MLVTITSPDSTPLQHMRKSYVPAAAAVNKAEEHVVSVLLAQFWHELTARLCLR
jgi:hypothetical protein